MPSPPLASPGAGEDHRLIWNVPLVADTVKCKLVGCEAVAAWVTTPTLRRCCGSCSMAICIFDVQAFADSVGGQAGDGLARWLTDHASLALAEAEADADADADTGVDAGTQTAEDFVEVDVAEALVAEACAFDDERATEVAAGRLADEERALAAHVRAGQLKAAIDIQTALLERAEARGAERERAAREAAEQRAAHEHARRQAAEQQAADAAAAQEAAERSAVAAEQRAAAAEQCAAAAEAR